jgi:CBS domain-containing protein/uncharacterized protein (DUF2267 family)
MSLKWYLRPRLVVLQPSAPALEAARAIENNKIGAVVVADKGGVVGIVTDRDLAIRLVGPGLDAKKTSIAEVMTTPVAMLSPEDSQVEAIRLMQEQHIRRIPIVDDGKIVGIVTLDDLLLDEAAPLEELAGVVQAQLGERRAGPAPIRQASRHRGDARAESTYGRFLKLVRSNTGLDSGLAETAVETVLSALVRRLTPGESKDLIAQLPSLLHSKLKALRAGPDKSITREAIESDLVRRLDIDPVRAAIVLRAVGVSIAQTVSAGQIEDVHSQLPEVLRSTFSGLPESMTT